MVPQRPVPPQHARWATCSFCGKRGWLTRRAAKTALKRYYPHQFQEMQVYRCPDGGEGFHHGHRVPKRFRDSMVSACRHCHREIHRSEDEAWFHVDDERTDCGIRSLDTGVLMAEPGWMVSGG